MKAGAFTVGNVRMEYKS